MQSNSFGNYMYSVGALALSAIALAIGVGEFHFTQLVLATSIPSSFILGCAVSLALFQTTVVVTTLFPSNTARMAPSRLMTWAISFMLPWSMYFAVFVVLLIVGMFVLNPIFAFARFGEIRFPSLANTFLLGRGCVAASFSLSAVMWVWAFVRRGKESDHS
jgi:hypothetical protein